MTAPLQPKMLLAMSSRLLRTALSLVCCAGFSVAQGRPAKVKCELAYTVTAAPGTKSLTLTAVLPQSIPGLQAVTATRFSHPPKEQLTESGVGYAVWEFAPVPEQLTITVAADLEIRAPSTSRPQVREKLDPKPWLAAEKYQEVDDPAIRKAAKQLAGQTAEELAKSAAKFVIGHLTHSGFDPASHGAAWALQEGRGDCTEFSDLMVALLRARGIPARQISGFTTDWSDTAKHSCVEVNLGRRGWVYFDPTLARRSPELLSGPRPTWIQMSTRRQDPRLENSDWFRYRFTGTECKVVGQVTIDAGKGGKSCQL